MGDVALPTDMREQDFFIDLELRIRAYVRAWIDREHKRAMLPCVWQPIATAPKDRTPVWIGVGLGPPSLKLGAIAIAYWCIGGWERTQGNCPVGFEPTHWMPLPKPPPPVEPEQKSTADDLYAIGWHPIRLAPKYGASIDLWHQVRGRFTDCRHIGDHWTAMADDGNRRPIPDHERLTHWMRIPNGPSHDGAP